MKKLLIAALAGCLLLTFYPTDRTRDEVVTLYTSLASYSAEQSTVLNSFQVAKEMQDNLGTMEATDLGEAISKFAINLCIELGNGDALKEADRVAEPFFQYSTSVISGNYTDYDELYENIKNHLATGQPANCHISCCAFATFCVQTFLGKPIYNRQVGNFRDTMKKSGVELQGDGTLANALEIAVPGDILWYRKEPETDKRHAALYIGEYTNGAVHYDKAIAHSSYPEHALDCIVANAEETNYDKVFVIRLKDLLEANNLVEADLLNQIPEEPLIQEVESHGS